MEYIKKLFIKIKLKRLKKKIYSYIPEQDFKPNFRYLKSIGFQEVDYGHTHPYNLWYEFQLGCSFKLCMNAFHEFSFWFDCKAYKKLYFLNDTELLIFIKTFNPTKNEASKN